MTTPFTRNDVSISTIRCALPEPMVESVAARLAVAVGRAITVTPWDRGAADGDVLLIAPHELSRRERDAALRAVRWSWVHLTSAGVDFIDLSTWDPAVLLTRSWRCYAAPLAEYAVHAMLSHEWRGRVRWEIADAAGPPVATGLWTASVGVAGWGAVGQRVAEVAAALGACVRVLSRTRRPVSPDGILHTSRLVDVLDVDHLVVALPLTPSTRKLFDREALRRARPGLHLINVSRAQIIDQSALCELCAAGRMWATLDVTEPEPLPADHPLRHIDSVRISDHVAWRSRGSDLAFVEDFADIWLARERNAAVIPGAVVAPTCSSVPGQGTPRSRPR
jgi:phosphoglycerate dehydrogenase-like enzyme